jgi:hypothetical protein
MSEFKTGFWPSIIILIAAKKRPRNIGKTIEKNPQIRLELFIPLNFLIFLNKKTTRMNAGHQNNNSSNLPSAVVPILGLKIEPKIAIIKAEIKLIL